jgi:putative DNA primase/helicase
MTQTIEAARGRWREILPALGLPPAILNGKQQPCPICGGTDRFQFTDRNGDGDFICRMCPEGMGGKGLQLLMRFHRWDFARAAKEVDTIIGNLPAKKMEPPPAKRITSDAELQRIWKTSSPIIPGSAAYRYLVGRGLPVVKYVASLRTTVASYGDKVFPILLAKFCDPAGNGKQLHQTFLNEDGSKATIEPNKRFMRGPLPKGGAIRLGPPAEVMGVAEGIETALSATTLYGMPVWATTSANMLEAFEPPTGVKRLIVFADNDASYTGQAAAFALAKRLYIDGKARGLDRLVDVKIPEVQGWDWNDVLMGEIDARITH